MTKVWDHGPEKQSHLLVLLALADYANDEGQCWPSMASIAKKARITERGARKIVRELEGNGWLSINISGGRNGTNVYIINPEQCSPRNDVPPEQECINPEQPFRGGRNSGSGEPSYNHQEPSFLSIDHPAPKSKPTDFFAEFWDRYPKRVGKADAHKAYIRAMKKITHDDLMFALSERLPALEAREKKYRPNPSTWLNQERWQDDIDTDHNADGSVQSRSRNGMVDAFAQVAAERMARDGRG